MRFLNITFYYLLLRYNNLPNYVWTNDLLIEN